MAAAAAAVGGGAGAGVQRGAGPPMRPSRVGRKWPQNFHFLAKAGAGADAEEKRRVLQQLWGKLSSNKKTVHYPFQGFRLLGKNRNKCLVVVGVSDLMFRCNML